MGPSWRLRRAQGVQLGWLRHLFGDVVCWHENHRGVDGAQVYEQERRSAFGNPHFLKELIYRGSSAPDASKL